MRQNEGVEVVAGSRVEGVEVKLLSGWDEGRVESSSQFLNRKSRMTVRPARPARLASPWCRSAALGPSAATSDTTAKCSVDVHDTGQNTHTARRQQCFWGCLLTWCCVGASARSRFLSALSLRESVFWAAPIILYTTALYCKYGEYRQYLSRQSARYAYADILFLHLTCSTLCVQSRTGQYWTGTYADAMVLALLSRGVFANTCGGRSRGICITCVLCTCSRSFPPGCSTAYRASGSRTNYARHMPTSLRAVSSRPVSSRFFSSLLFSFLSFPPPPSRPSPFFFLSSHLSTIDYRLLTFTSCRYFFSSSLFLPPPPPPPPPLPFPLSFRPPNRRLTKSVRRSYPYRDT